MKSPTVSPLFNDDGFAVKIAVKKSEVPTLLPKLQALGASDIVEYELRKVMLQEVIMRTATVKRETGETQIELTLNLDGTGKCDVKNPIGFFDHMLRSFCKHGLFDLTGTIKGDLNVDQHRGQNPSSFFP